jgi:phosphatidylserine/phosphatidylglycerophosphate/cardiolipin synthase-like enzyme
MTDDASAHALPSNEEARFRLLRNGEEAFARIALRIRCAKRSIRLRCFHWHDDEAGEMIARSLLEAAQRGVEVTVFKDRVGANYEYLEGSQQSLLHKEMDLVARLQTLFLMAVYDRWGSLRQRPNPLAEALAAHPLVRIVADEKRFDHSKVYVIDDEVMILGGMGIGDNFWRSNVDFMVEIESTDIVQRFHDIEAGRSTFDPRRDVDFLVHAHGRRNPLPEARVALLASAKERLTIEMAYLGDPRMTNALVSAVRRGVRVTLLTARRASIIGDLNLGTCDRILRRTGAPDHLRIVLHPRMIHGKAIVADGRIVDIGSANFTLLSHHAYLEVDLYCRNEELSRRIEEAIEREIEAGEIVRPTIPYSRTFFFVEHAIVTYQARFGAAARRRAEVPVEPR